MPLGTCVWCSRFRLVSVRTWRSPRTGEQLVGDVCGHCYLETGGWDDCRTCRAREKARPARAAGGVHALGRADVFPLLAQHFGWKDRRRG